MKKTHGTRGRSFSLALTVSGAARRFAQDRGKLHRWIRAGILKKCNEAGVYSAKGKFVWGCDIADLLNDPERKRGKRLVPLKPAKKTKWQLAKEDPEKSHYQRQRSRSTAGDFAKDFCMAANRIHDPAVAAETLRVFLPVLKSGLDHLREVAMRQQKPQPSRRPAAA